MARVPDTVLQRVLRDVNLAADVVPDDLLASEAEGPLGRQRAREQHHRDAGAAHAIGPDEASQQHKDPGRRREAGQPGAVPVVEQQRAAGREERERQRQQQFRAPHRRAPREPGRRWRGGPGQRQQEAEQEHGERRGLIRQRMRVAEQRAEQVGGQATGHHHGERCRRYVQRVPDKGGTRDPERAQRDYARHGQGQCCQDERDRPNRTERLERDDRDEPGPSRKQRPQSAASNVARAALV